MANPSGNGGDVFDIKRVRRLVELMQENALTELDIQQGDMRIQLKRNSGTPVSMAPMPVAAPQPVALPTPVPVANTPTPTLAEEKNVHIITSPMVGTFYAASSPDAPPFAKVGDSVSPDKTVCLIEAMKVYNEIQAECTGKIVAVLAKNAATVEFGTPLFKVATDE